MNVNWRWHRRYRSLLPLAPQALADDGRLVFVRPDELEARKYQVLQISGVRGQGSGVSGGAVAPPSDRPEGTPSLTLDPWPLTPGLIAAVSVETVRQMLVSAEAGLSIGVTEDNLYLFREGRKSRFLADRQVSYLSVALARGGDRFACAFTDMLFAGHTLCLADAAGKVVWTRDMDAPISQVAIAPDGRTVAAGMEDGTVVAYDAGRALRWEVALEEPAAALALADGPDGRCVVATAAGAVLAVDAGDVAWQINTDRVPAHGGRPPGAPLLVIACDARSALTAVGSGGDMEGWVLLLDAEGRQVWEHGTGSPITGVALAPTGGLLALSQADGELLLLEIEGAAAGRLQGAAGEEELRRALAARDAGRTEEARQALLRVLEADPGHGAACEALIALDLAARQEALAEVDHLMAETRFSEALARLEVARAVAPGDVELPRRWTSVLEAAEVHLAGEAARAEADGDLEAAAARWRDLTRLDPKRRRAREEIRRLNHLVAERLAQEGEAALAAGREEEALAAWRRAQAAAPSEALAARLREIEVQGFVRAGIELYGQQRFAEAAFQLRKALALQPDHPEALRHLAYISGTGPQSPLSERFSRLE